MSEHPFADVVSLGTEATPWAPSANLRRWLLIGAWALAVSMCLSAASLSIDLSRTKEPQGFTITEILLWADVLPQILALLAVLALAREVASIGLWRSGIGVWGSGWLFIAMGATGFTGGEDVNLWDVLIMVAVGVGLVCLFVLVARKPVSFLPPVPVEPNLQEPAAPEPTSDQPSADQTEKPPSRWSPWPWLYGLAVVGAARALRNLFRHIRVNWGVVGAFALVVLLCCLFCSFLTFWAWFGISKIRLRRKLGSMAAVSGWADLVSTGLWAASHVFTTFAIIQATLHDQELDLYDPRFRIHTPVVDGCDLARMGLFAALFLSIRGRVARPQRLVPGGV